MLLRSGSPDLDVHLQAGAREKKVWRGQVVMFGKGQVMILPIDTFLVPVASHGRYGMAKREKSQFR